MFVIRYCVENNARSTIAVHSKEPIPKINKKNIPRKGIARSQSQFPYSCVCERYIYSHDQSAYIFCCRKYADLSWEYIDRSQKHECGNWD
jgi:hypothetical protein